MRKLCIHNRELRLCGPCGGYLTCQHRRRRNTCVDCVGTRGSQICEHKKRLHRCFLCGGFQALAKELYLSARRRARIKKVPFDISIQDVIKWIGDGTCPVFGVPYSFLGKLSRTSATLDRTVPKLGYTKTNCSVISFLANTIKSDATQEQVQRVADWMKK